MKSVLISAVVFVFGIALASAAFAQGRHDEKPHGSAKPSAGSTEGKYEPMPGGRHDEKPHGPRKPAAKKSESEKADAPKSPEADKGGK